MYNQCCVVYCASRRQDVSLHMFPKSEIGLKKWLDNINCERLRSLSFENLRKQFVCQKHFEKRFIASPGERTRLRRGAYPTLFTDSEISSGIPQTAMVPIDIEGVIYEHNYSKKRHVDHNYCKPDVMEKRCKIDELNVMPLSQTAPDLPSKSKDVINKSPMQVSVDEAVYCTPRHNVVTKRRQRIVHLKNKLTPNCKRLYKEYKKSRRQLNFSQRAKRALKFSKEESFKKLTQSMNPLTKKFIWMQIKQCTKKSRGRRFTQEEKLIALSILKQSPKCYRYLHKIFILPSKYTLNKMIAELKVEAGINPQIFNAVKEEVSRWDEKKKMCSIVFDEMSLEAALSYDKHRDAIDGFVELDKKYDEFADHALVFMLRGVVHKWQQPLAFYFCKGATSGPQLKIIIKEIIMAVGDTGLLPIAIVCDQGSSFQSALKSLQEDTYRDQMIAGDKIEEVISINGHTLSVINDPPHLLKGLRNNFLTKNINYKGAISKWSDLIEVYKTDCNHTQIRLLHKLNDEHIIPEKIKKMKVKNCARVFSKTVAATLAYTAQFSHYADGKEVSPTLKNTAEIISFFDDLFDSVNGAAFNKTSKGKPLRQAVTENSPHRKFWKEAIEKLENIKFIDCTGKQSIPPSLKNWISTLRSFERIWQYLTNNNIKIMRPRYLNSDPIENFFGQVRAYNFRNNDPDCRTFKSTFRSLLITRFIQFHSDSYNCEEDSGEQLLKLNALFKSHESEHSNKNVESNENNLICSPQSSELSSAFENIDVVARQERLNVHSHAYTTGWVIRKILVNNNCENCERNLTSRESTYDKNKINNWISFKEFKTLKQKKLTYPSEHAVRVFRYVTLEANKYLETQCHKNGIANNIKNYIKSKCLFDFLECELHKDIVSEYFLTLTLRLIIFNWCHIINKIMKGKDVIRLNNKILPKMQAKALEKCKKNYRNKK